MRSPTYSTPPRRDDDRTNDTAPANRPTDEADRSSSGLRRAETTNDDANYRPKIYAVERSKLHQWDTTDWRYKETGLRDTFEQLTARLDYLAAEESVRSGIRIWPFVLNLQRPERPNEHEERSPG